MLLACVQCGAEFQKISKSLHCSKQCATKSAKANKKASRPPYDSARASAAYQARCAAQPKREPTFGLCKQCGTEFRKSGKNLHCSDACSKKGKKEYKAGYKKANPQPYDSARGRVSYLTFRAAHPKAELPLVACAQCGTEFRPKPNKRIYCSACSKKVTATKFRLLNAVRGPKREFCKCGCRGSLDGSYRPGIDYLMGHTPKNRASHSGTYLTKPEMLLHTALHPHGFDYVGCTAPSSLGLPLSADILSTTHKILVMVDGCYWHECPLHGRGKFPERPKRDAKNRARARSLGWTVVEVWEHDLVAIRGDKPPGIDAVVRHVVSYIETSPQRVPTK